MFEYKAAFNHFNFFIHFWQRVCSISMLSCSKAGYYLPLFELNLRSSFKAEKKNPKPLSGYCLLQHTERERERGVRVNCHFFHKFVILCQTDNLRSKYLSTCICFIALCSHSQVSSDTKIFYDHIQRINRHASEWNLIYCSTYSLKRCGQTWTSSEKNVRLEIQ